jgi:WD40 repeat protein
MRDLAFSPDGTILASTGDEKLVLWGVRTGKRLREASWKWASGIYVTFVSNGKEVACTAGEGNRIRLLDVRSLTCRATFSPSPRSYFSCLAASTDGKLLAAADGCTVTVWNVAIAKRVLHIDLKLMSRSIDDLAFDPSGKELAVGVDEDDVIRLYDVAAGKESRRLANPEAKRRGG